MNNKKKLLVVAGAGSALDFGMPSVEDVNKIFLSEAQKTFPLISDVNNNLYQYLYDELKCYWSKNIGRGLKNIPNYEDVLYAVYALSSLGDRGMFTGSLGAFIDIKKLPEVKYYGEEKDAFKILINMSCFLIDRLFEELKEKCRSKNANFDKLQDFFSQLSEEFAVSVITTNHDDLIYRCLHIETGFDLDDKGKFKPQRIIEREAWSCLLHLHGSVHFDCSPNINTGEIHTIHWEDDLDKVSLQNSFGSSSQESSEGISFPTSNIIAGYGKTMQLQRFPFRTYYSELDRLVLQSDSVLFLGYGFGDKHINEAFNNYQSTKIKPVTVIDFAYDPNSKEKNAKNIMAARAGGGSGDILPSVSMISEIMRVDINSMGSNGRVAPALVNEFVENEIFESLNSKNSSLSIWYNGMLKACKNIDKVLNELKRD